MAKIIFCDDGTVVTGDTDEELLAQARRHLREAHPDLAGTVSDEQLLGMAVQAPGGVTRR